MANITKVEMFLFLLALTFSVEFVTPSCLLASPDSLCLEPPQVTKIAEDEAIRTDIRNNYFTNINHYSKLAPIVNLTVTQINTTLLRYGAFFKRVAPEAPTTYLWNNTMYPGSLMLKRRRRRRQLSSDYVCPSDGVYSDINFCISNAGDVLQMVQMGDDRQWVMTETCQDPAGNGVPNTICVDRIREVPAVVVNLDIPESVTIELIQVSCCAAHGEL